MGQRKSNIVTKELLIALRDYIETSTPFFGLCGVILDMLDTKLINEVEYNELCDFLERHAMPYKERYFPDNAYWWKPSEKPPRIEWLNKHIKRL